MSLNFYTWQYQVFPLYSLEIHAKNVKTGQVVLERNARSIIIIMCVRLEENSFSYVYLSTFSGLTLEVILLKMRWASWNQKFSGKN